MTQKHCTKKTGKIIQIDEEQVKDHLGEVAGKPFRRRSIRCWTKRPTGFVERSDMRGQMRGRIPEPAITVGSSTPRLEKWISKCPS